MRTSVLPMVCSAVLLALLPETGLAHGGQYRGPADVVPPGAGGRGGSGPAGPVTGGPGTPGAPTPGGPVTPGAAGPGTGGPGGPGGGRPGQTGRGGVELTEDMTDWRFWWEFNKDPFIRLKDAVQQGGAQTGSDDFHLGGTRRKAARDSLKPTEEQILGEILPALKKAIDSTKQRDINSSCMVAMAKVGKDHSDFKLIDVFTPRLKDGDQELRETAALSIGIAAIADGAELETLVGLALDNETGKRLSGGSVDNRTRAFATYGIGLLVHGKTNLKLKAEAFAALKTLVDDDGMSNRDVKVAAIHAIGLLNIDGSASAEAKVLLDQALETLEAYYGKKLGPGQQLIQAHVPTAIAKLIGKRHERAEHYKQLFAKDLLEKGEVKRSSHDIARSCVLALGKLALPYDSKDDQGNPDHEYSKVLLECYQKHKDLQTRFFSVLALGQIGGEQNRAALLKAFDSAGKSQEKPWVAMGLGVYSFFEYETQKAAGAIELEREIGATLLRAFKSDKDPNLRGALAVAMGLNQTTEAADAMVSMLLSSVAQEELAGYLCIGLALMNHTRAVPDIKSVVDQAARRTKLLQQAAVALGKLGDKSVADQLQKLMTDGEPNLAKLSAIASALGFIGDSRTIAPLRRMLFDEQLGDLSRAFAAVALGGVADKEPLPWNSKIGVDSNYRASVETLTSGFGTGILDIL